MTQGLAATPLLWLTGLGMVALAAAIGWLLGTDLPEAGFGYSVDALRHWTERAGPEGLRLYRRVSLGLDTLLPLCYAGFLVGLMRRLLAGLPAATPTRWLVLLPALAALADLAENLQLVRLTLDAPALGATPVAWAAASTQLKWTLLALSLLALAGLVLRRLQAAIRPAQDPPGASE